jgi:hypothetical protein
MDEDERGGIQEEGALDDLAWIHGSVVDCALLLYLVGDQVVLAIEEQDAKELDLFVGHGGLTVVEERLPIAQGRAALHGPEQQSARDGANEAHQCHVACGRPEFRQLCRLCGKDVAETMEPLQQQRCGRATWCVGQKPR